MQMPWESGNRGGSNKTANPAAAEREQELLPCPRCDSTNTKFCYYNNYNFSQPRHLCKSCRRYWTHGGTLRDIPVGGATRKNAKRHRTSLYPSPAATPPFTSLLNNTAFGLWPFPGNDTWQFDAGFSWPHFAISTPGNALK